jgi:hypothetical protein
MLSVVIPNIVAPFFLFLPLKTFFFISDEKQISWSVFLQSFYPVVSNISELDWSKGRLLTLPAKIMKGLTRDKHSSLFTRGLSDEEKILLI